MGRSSISPLQGQSECSGCRRLLRSRSRGSAGLFGGCGLSAQSKRHPWGAAHGYLERPWRERDPCRSRWWLGRGARSSGANGATRLPQLSESQGGHAPDACGGSWPFSTVCGAAPVSRRHAAERFSSISLNDGTRHAASCQVPGCRSMVPEQPRGISHVYNMCITTLGADVVLQGAVRTW